MTKQREPFFFGGPIYRKQKRDWADAKAQRKTLQQRIDDIDWPNVYLFCFLFGLVATAYYLEQWTFADVQAWLIWAIDALNYHSH